MARVALGYGTVVAPGFQKWSFGMVVGGISVSFDARSSGERLSRCWGEECHANILSFVRMLGSESGERHQNHFIHSERAKELTSGSW